MVYKYYKNCRDSAWRILVDMSVDSLPVNVVSVCRELGIRVKRFELDEGEDGNALITTKGPLILVRPGLPPKLKRYIIAHELGHFILGHVKEFDVLHHDDGNADNPIEREANSFAVRLLAPACVLWGCCVETAQQIEELCGIPHEEAEKRMKRIKLLNKRDSFFKSDTEKVVFEQFADFIDNYKRGQNVK